MYRRFVICNYPVAEAILRRSAWQSSWRRGHAVPFFPPRFARGSADFCLPVLDIIPEDATHVRITGSRSFAGFGIG